MDFIIFCLVMNFSLLVPSLALYYWGEGLHGPADAWTRSAFWPVFLARGAYRSFIRMWRNQ